MSTKRRCAIASCLLVGSIAGCSNDTSGGVDASVDAATIDLAGMAVRDLARQEDAIGDFAMDTSRDLAESVPIDAAQPDLASPEDLAPPLDLAVPVDGASPIDASAQDDLAMTSRDLALTTADLAMTTADLARTFDLAVTPDLVVPPDLTPPPDLANPRDLATNRDLAGTFCTPVFVRTVAIETDSGRVLPARGGLENHQSVVTIYSTIAPVGFMGPVVLLWDTAVADCALATFPNTKKLIDVGGGMGGEDFTEIIPAYKAGTHVCWTLRTTACGGVFSDPPAGQQPYNYTTQ